MAKTVKPTVAEKVIILKRLQAKYPKMFKPGWGKTIKGSNAYSQYAKESASPSFRGASGSDLAELNKRFGRKKK